MDSDVIRPYSYGHTPPNNTPDTGRKVRLRSLAELDGRTQAAKAAKALIAELEADLGGADRLSAGEHEIVQRCALASAMLRDMEANWLSGRPLDIAAYTTLANTQSRLLKLLGLERRPRDVTPDLHRYIAARAEPPSHTPAPVPPPPPPPSAAPTVPPPPPPR
jgi:hypothetical protein